MVSAIAAAVAASTRKTAGIPLGNLGKGLGQAASWLKGAPGAVTRKVLANPLKATALGAGGTFGGLAAREAYNEFDPTAASRFQESSKKWMDQSTQFRDANEAFRAGTSEVNPGQGRFERTWLGRQVYGTPRYSPEQREQVYQQNLGKLETGNFHASPTTLWSAGGHRERALQSAKELGETPQYVGGIGELLSGRSHDYDPQAVHAFMRDYRGVQPQLRKPMGPAPVADLSAYLRGQQMASGRPTWASVYGGS